MALPGLIDTLLYSCLLEGSCYDCLWRGDNGTWHRNISSAYHRWPEPLALHLLFWSVRRSLYGERKETHTHTHTHTHTLIIILCCLCHLILCILFVFILIFCLQPGVIVLYLELSVKFFVDGNLAWCLSLIIMFSFACILFFRGR